MGTKIYLGGFTKAKWTDLFPFGKFKNQKYEEVSQGYFFWLWDQDWLFEKYPQVHDFIKRNWEEIQEMTCEDEHGDFLDYLSHKD